MKKSEKEKKPAEKAAKVIIRVFIDDRNRQAFSMTRSISNFTDYIDMLQEFRKRLSHELKARGILRLETTIPRNRAKPVKLAEPDLGLGEWWDEAA